MPIARVLACDVFLPSPGPGVAVNASTYATTRGAPRLLSVHGLISRSDTVDVSFRRFSEDNGRTWGPVEEWPTKFEAPNGTGRRHPRGGYLDPKSGRFLEVWTEGVLPTDNPLEGMRQWGLMYAVSEDGGRTDRIGEPLVQDEPGYDADHPLPGVVRGKTSVMIGDLTCRPITLKDGAILLPVQATPAGPDGFYHKPANALTFTDALVLRGRWKPDGRLAWTASARVSCDPGRSTRGMIEPTLAELPDGRILMVMRGSNDAQQTMPGRRWHAFSSDQGRTWSAPEPWRYTDGEVFFSPSSCSQLVPHSSGRIFWVGNISAQNPRCNSPRYPLVLAEVDRNSGLLKRDTLAVLDDRRPGENERLTLSNFLVREDLESPDLLLHLSRYFAKPDLPGGKPDWTADALIYRIRLGD
jgi:hypothetical protein